MEGFKYIIYSMSASISFVFGILLIFEELDINKWVGIVLGVILIIICFLVARQTINDWIEESSNERRER